MSEFTMNRNGTFHPDMAYAGMVGLLAGIIIHPNAAYALLVDKDYPTALQLQEYAVLPNSSIHNSMSMEN